ncbi:hypothetical protein GTP46_11375 [Duganella sp. FT135W]|uniref:Uncharacterized protein n=1 Tax=Duganella flavida TaxID=2692175 RepID=A0A6L8K788_9BURK|nr:hypothetical protein [Duganella flavida]MYM23246.1 hypothetical protein [Duganella flavida]
MEGHSRKNLKLAQIVEVGVALSYTDSTAVGWAYLEHHGVPSKMILRVLTDSLSRRYSDTPLEMRKFPEDLANASTAK